MKKLFIFAKVIKLHEPVIYTMKRTFICDAIENTHNSLAPIRHHLLLLQFGDISVFKYTPYLA